MSKAIQRLLGLVKEEIRSFKIKRKNQSAPILGVIGAILYLTAATAYGITANHSEIQIKLNTDIITSQKKIRISEVLRADDDTVKNNPKWPNRLKAPICSDVNNHKNPRCNFNYF